MVEIKDQTVEFFRSRGWEIVLSPDDQVTLQKVVHGNPLKCADDRYDGSHSPAPAFFGGTGGIAALCAGIPTSEGRFLVAVDKIERSGFKPAIHGDEDHGDIRGCAFHKFWIEDKIPGLPQLSELQAKVTRLLHKFHHVNLKGPHKAMGFLVNFNEGFNAQPKEYLVGDLWYPLSLGFDLEEILKLSAHAAELILPKRDWRLFLPE